MNRNAHTVHIRLIGAHDDVAFWLRLLEMIATLENVTNPDIDREGTTRVLATISRTFPLTGGPR